MADTRKGFVRRIDCAGARENMKGIEIESRAGDKMQLTLAEAGIVAGVIVNVLVGSLPFESVGYVVPSERVDEQDGMPAGLPGGPDHRKTH